MQTTKWPGLAAASLFITLVGLRLGALSAAPAAAGADTFKAKCAMCHGPDGIGNTPIGLKMKIRDLRSPEIQKQTDNELTAFITNGKPPMPAYGKTLAAGDIQQLVAYVRSIATKS